MSRRLSEACQSLTDTHNKDITAYREKISNLNRDIAQSETKISELARNPSCWTSGGGKSRRRHKKRRGKKTRRHRSKRYKR